MIYPDRQNTCTVIVTYNPDFQLSNNLERHLEIVDKVVIVDNGSIYDIESFLTKTLIAKIEIIHSLKNKGIAWALNEGIRWAQKQSYEWIFTFDQDSFPNLHILNYYSDVIRQEKNVGLLGTSFSDEELVVSHVRWKHKLTLITSGTLHSSRIFKVVGYYNEDLFIDGVDFDYALRTHSFGFSVIRIQNSLLKHQLGSPIKKYGITSSNHNLVRRYYYARNHAFLTKVYFFKYPFWILKKNYCFFKSILFLIIIENDVAPKLSVIFKGLKDGFKGF